MPKSKKPDSDFGEDSFLDVVANVVGVLIILVMLIGARASQSATTPSVESEHDEPPVAETIVKRGSVAELNDKLEQIGRQVLLKRSKLDESRSRLMNARHQRELQNQHRLELAVHRSRLEEDLERRRVALSTESKQEFDVQNQITTVKLELSRLSEREFTLLSAPGVVEEIEVEPTPIAREVDEKATHLRLLGGKVCRVPIFELVEEMKYEYASIQRELNNTNRVNRMMGPIDGFRVRLTTMQIPPEEALTGPLVGQLSRRDAFIPIHTFYAESDQLGEHLEQCLLPQSNLRNLLVDARRESSVIVAWVYNDSFDEFRKLKKLLTEMEFSVATYTLSEGGHIGISPLGRKAHTQ